MHSNKIGDYLLEQPLGSGAVGVAYRGRHVEREEPVAIKLLHGKTAGEPDIQKRFVREVSVLEKLEHPNIVRHLDCGIDEDGRLYFVMELVDSGTLKDVIAKRGRLPWREAAECAAQICDALDHAHERGVIHRDLKPANLFLSSDGRVKVGDFGLARDMNMHRLTAHGNTVGTCRYMAPEQVRGESTLTGTADLYAVGCMMYEMISGHVPYDGQTVVEVFEHHLFSPIPSLAAVRGTGVPLALVDLTEQLMAKAPQARPLSADDVADALRHIVRGEEIRLPIMAAVDLPPTEAPPVASPNLVERMLAPPEETHSPFWLVAGGVAGVAALAGILWIVFSL